MLDRVGPAVVIGAGSDATGAWRAWVYRTADGSTCLEVSSGDSSSSACGLGGDPVTGLGIGMGGAADYVSGGTRQPDSTAARVELASGQAVVVSLVAAPAIAPGAKFFAARVPAGSHVVAVRILDAAGTVLETLATPEADPRKEPPVPTATPTTSAAVRDTRTGWMG